MASGVNIKMGVTGVAQFKQNINQAKQSVKTLDAQLALNEKQFKATGDAEEYMKQKAELLKAKIEEQKTIAAQAEQALKKMADNGVDKTSKAFQDMQQQMLRAKGEILDAEMQMQGLETAGKDAAKSANEMNQELKQIGTGVSFQNVTEGINKITSGLEAAAKKAVQVGKKLIQSSMDSAHWADDLATRATRYGVGVEDLQAMDNVAAYIDTDVDAIINAQKRLRKAMGSDNKETMGVFAALGIDPSNKDWESAFWKAGEALRKMSDDVEKENYAQKIFGRSWDDLNPLFEAGEQEYKRRLSEQTVLTKEQVEALTKEDDAVQKLNQQMELLKEQFWAGLAPAITDVTNSLSGLMEQFNKYLSTDEGKEMLAKLNETFSMLLNDLTNIDPKDIMGGLKGALDSLQQGMEWIRTNKDGIVKAIEGIGIAFGTLKAAELATDLGRIVSGMRNLLRIGGGGGAAAGAAGGSAGISAIFSKVAGGIESLIASGAGMSAGIFAGAIAPAVWANYMDDQRVEAKRLDRLAKAAMIQPGIDQDWLTRSANALGKNWHGGNEAEIESILMGMKNRSDLQKAQLQAQLNGYTANGNSTWDTLQRYWNGEPMDMGRLNATLQSITDAYAKMAESNNDISKMVDTNRQSSSDMKNAANVLATMPNLVENAIIRGMSQIKIYMDSNQVGHSVAPAVNGALGAILNLSRR